MFETALKERAMRNLTNTSVITDEVIAIAAAETEEICLNRTVPQWAKLDIGIYRLKVNLKIGISDADEFTMKEAMREVKASPLAVSETETVIGGAVVKNGGNSWL